MLSVATGLKHDAGSFPVRFESVPLIEFPKSVPTVRNIDFWVTASMVVNADGSLRDVQVSQESAAAVAEQIFYENVRSKTRGKKSDEIRSELVQILTNQMKESKFKPRVSNGEALPTMIFVNSHFRLGSDSCPQIVTEVRLTGGVLIWEGITSNECWKPSPGVRNRRPD
jgi:hypothetical protein